MKAILTQVFS